MLPRTIYCNNPILRMIGNSSAKTTIADATIPDPEELEQRDVGELRGIPMPRKVRRDRDSAEEGADDEDVNEDVELDDDLPDREKEDLQQGDEGIDDA
ncbi:MAG: hypothetical protein U0984_02625 [Prosthecobacter sp.]|nr:hypothetical protein [Prosthecobacter sp.]